MDSFDDHQVFNIGSVASPQKNYDQPKTHKGNKSCVDFFTCCQSAETDLSQNQLFLFYTLKPYCNNLYDEAHPSHQAQLKELYFLVFHKSLDSQDLKSEDWIVLGFQSKNAQTDFRGAGVLGLQNLSKFVRNQKNTVEEMCTQSNEFLFAMTSLNISFHLKIFFHLADYLTIEKDRKVICSRPALKNFVRVLENGLKLNLNLNLAEAEVVQNIFYEIHEILVIFCFKKWIHLKTIRKQTTFMDFYLVFEEMKRLILEIFNSDNVGSVSQLRDFFQNIFKIIK